MRNRKAGAEHGSGQPLRGQRAVVTGANSGIGRATALALARAGAAVAVNWLLNREEATRLVREITEVGGLAMAVKADVSSERQVRSMFRQVVKKLGGVDILVNNAGIGRPAIFSEKILEDWEAVLAVNLTGQFLCAREAVREFLRRGVVPELSSAAGKIVCISSIHDSIPMPRHVDYAVSKAGVTMLAKALALELAPHRIRVNCVAPGAVRTTDGDSGENYSEEERAVLERIPYGRLGEPEDIARAVVWLASDDSDYLNGAVLAVDGGRRLYPGYPPPPFGNPRLSSG